MFQERWVKTPGMGDMGTKREDHGQDFVPLFSSIH